MPSGHPGREHGAPRPLRSLIIVLAVIVALTVGWPVVSRAVSDDQPVAAGQPLTIGPAGSHSATFTPGPDWAVHSAETNTVESWRLSHGPVDLTVAYVTLLSRSQAGCGPACSARCCLATRPPGWAGPRPSPAPTAARG